MIVTMPDTRKDLPHLPHCSVPIRASGTATGLSPAECQAHAAAKPSRLAGAEPGLFYRPSIQERGALPAARPCVYLLLCPTSWTSRKTSSGSKGLISLGYGALLLQATQDQFRAIALIPRQCRHTSPAGRARPDPDSSTIAPVRRTGTEMQLEFHQLDRRWEHCGPPSARNGGCWPRWPRPAADAHRVVVAEGQADRYLVIDGYKRLAALQQLGRDTVEAVIGR